MSVISICCVKSFLEGIREKLLALGFYSVLVPCQDSTIAWKLDINSPTKCLKICNLMFRNAPEIMIRKFNKYKELVSYKKNLERKNALQEIAQAELVIADIESRLL